MVMISGNRNRRVGGDRPPKGCTHDRCGGDFVRYSLGCGIGVYRCTRCFERYDADSTPTKMRQPLLKRVLHDLATWREDD